MHRVALTILSWLVFSMASTRTKASESILSFSCSLEVSYLEKKEYAKFELDISAKVHPDSGALNYFANQVKNLTGNNVERFIAEIDLPSAGRPLNLRLDKGQWLSLNYHDLHPAMIPIGVLAEQKNRFLVKHPTTTDFKSISTETKLLKNSHFFRTVTDQHEVPLHLNTFSYDLSKKRSCWTGIKTDPIYFCAKKTIRQFSNIENLIKGKKFDFMNEKSPLALTAKFFLNCVRNDGLKSHEQSLIRSCQDLCSDEKTSLEEKDFSKKLQKTI